MQYYIIRITKQVKDDLSVLYDFLSNFILMVPHCFSQIYVQYISSTEYEEYQFVKSEQNSFRILPKSFGC